MHAAHAPPTGARSLIAVSSLDATAVVARLRDEHACALSALDADACEALLAEARTLGWRPARELVGKPGREVRQAMEICTGLPPGGLFEQLAGEWQALCDEALARLPASPFEGRLAFNDRLLQRYAPVPVGITPHRDRVGYRNLVCLFVLCGEGRFCVCDDRAGGGAREVPARPGDVLLMRAPGFEGSRLQPFHFVDRVRSARYVFGLRHAVEPARERY